MLASITIEINIRLQKRNRGRCFQHGGPGFDFNKYKMTNGCKTITYFL